MFITGFRQKLQQRRRRSAVHVALQAFHPDTGQAVGAKFATLDAALGRAAALLQGGYCFEIWSPASLERTGRSA